MFRRRGGFALVELTMACLLLGATVTVALSLLVWASQDRRAVEQQREALLEVANVMEEVSSWQWDKLTPEAVSQFPVPERVQRQLPEAVLHVTVSEDAAAANAKRIAVALSWRNRAGQRQAPVRVASWVYKPEGAP